MSANDEIFESESEPALGSIFNSAAITTRATSPQHDDVRISIHPPVNFRWVRTRLCQAPRICAAVASLAMWCDAFAYAHRCVFACIHAAHAVCRRQSIRRE